MLQGGGSLSSASPGGRARATSPAGSEDSQDSQAGSDSDEEEEFDPVEHRRQQMTALRICAQYDSTTKGLGGSASP